MSVQSRAELPRPFPGYNATAYGQDNFGYWQAFNLMGVNTRFRWIAPGTFMMGSPEMEDGRYDDELQHPVSLSCGYWLAETACSQALWQAVTGEDPSVFKGVDLPVENISWNDVQEKFLAHLNPNVKDTTLRLPTEAEWEYACRAGSEGAFNFGESINTDIVNYSGRWAGGDDRTDDYRGKTVDVEMFSPNVWGLYQMHGNVWEWCEDWLDDYSSGAAVDPTGALEGQDRVLRGGSWRNLGRVLRSAYRVGLVPDFRDVSIGFRLAQVPRE